MEDWKQRAAMDCVQDSYENCPFASVGGLDKRSEMVAPTWAAGHEAEYLERYREVALRMYGDDWQTCSFGWKASITIEAEPAKEESPHTGFSGTAPNAAEIAAFVDPPRDI